jgi:hypothetical protein
LPLSDLLTNSANVDDELLQVAWLGVAKKDDTFAIDKK